MPLVTVVTAARDAEEFLPDAIASIHAQTMSDWELIVVDDASTDGTVAIAEAAAEQDPRVRVVKNPASIGSYAAANVGIALANGAYVARLDADDISLPDRLEAQVAALRANPGRRACASWYRNLTSSGVESTIRRAPSRSNAVIKWHLWMGVGLLHSSALIETACFNEIGGYGTERVGEDVGLWGALVRNNWLHVEEQVLVHYRMHEKQITATEGWKRDNPARIKIRLAHMNACGAGDWTWADAHDFPHIGADPQFPMARPLELLPRWEAAWRADPAVTEADRAELARTATRRYLKHLRQRLRVNKTDAALGAARSVPRLTKSLVSYARDGR